MSVMSRCRAWVRSMGAADVLDADLDRELSDWVDELTVRYEASGLAQQEARRRALIETGGVQRVKEAVYDARVGNALNGLLRDVRYGWRCVWKQPSLTGVVVLTLALGIGSTTAMFSVINAMLIAPLPYRDASQLVFVWSDMTKSGLPRAPLSGRDLSDLREQGTLFTGFGAIWATSAALSGDDDPEQLRVGVVTADFFSILGVDAALGRTFVPEDEGEGPATRILLSATMWQRRYGADPGIVGRRIRLNGSPMTVVGVMPPDFKLLLPPDASVPEDLQAWIPFARTLTRGPRGPQFLRVVGRMQPAITIDRAERQIAGIEANTRDSTEAGLTRVLKVVPLHDDGVRQIRPALLTLFGGVGLLLAIACVNVASLLLARGASRAGETALRIALGAGRLQLFRQYLVEGVILSTLGGMAGLIVARWGLVALIAFRPENLSRIGSARIDFLVLIFTAGIALTWGVLCSLAPAIEVLRTRATAVFQIHGNRGGSEVRSRTLATLVVAQIALGMVLLIGSGLLVRTFVALQHVDPGFRSDGLLSFRVALPGSRYPTPTAFNVFARTLETKLLALPGVSAVGAVTHVPFDQQPNWSGAYATKTGVLKSAAPLADYRAMSPRYFEAVSARLIDGRLFTETDDEHRDGVVIVDDVLAQRVWPGQRAVGQRLAVDPNLTGRTDRIATVVGVVHHLRSHNLMHDVREQVYFPWRQVPWNPVAYVVRSSGDPGGLTSAVRRVVGELDSLLPVYDVRPLADYSGQARGTQRFTMMLAATFAAAALILGCVGVYGVMAYSVARRRHEFGVRLALGARPAQVMALVLTDGVKLTATGLGFGLFASVAAARLLQNQLFGVSPHDLTNYAIAVPLLGVCAIAACWIPAWRATLNTPFNALRDD